MAQPASANSSSGSDNAKEDQQLDQMIATAVAAAAQGESVASLLEVLLASFPPSAKDKIRQRFVAALKKRGLKEPLEGEVPSRGAIARIRDMFAQSARQAIDRIVALVRSRPDVAASIAQAGKMLIKNGVIAERVDISEADLGSISPLAGTGKQVTQSTERK
jgi:hypothetical protein